MSTLASMRAPVSKARRHARFPVRRHRPTHAAASAGATLHHCRLEDSPSLHRLSRRGGSSLLQRSLSARRPADGGSLHTGFSKRVFGSVYASGILTSKLRTIYKNKEKLNRAGCNLPEDGGNRSRGGACGDCGLVRTGGKLNRTTPNTSAAITGPDSDPVVRRRHGNGGRPAWNRYPALPTQAAAANGK